MQDHNFLRRFSFINPFHATVLVLYSLKILENLLFTDFLQGTERDQSYEMGNIFQ